MRPLRGGTIFNKIYQPASRPPKAVNGKPAAAAWYPDTTLRYLPTSCRKLLYLYRFSRRARLQLTSPGRFGSNSRFDAPLAPHHDGHGPDDTITELSS
jgi:hypothetical protein